MAQTGQGSSGSSGAYDDGGSYQRINIPGSDPSNSTGYVGYTQYDLGGNIVGYVLADVHGYDLSPDTTYQAGGPTWTQRWQTSFNQTNAVMSGGLIGKAGSMALGRAASAWATSWTGVAPFGWTSCPAFPAAGAETLTALSASEAWVAAGLVSTGAAAVATGVGMVGFEIGNAIGSVITASGLNPFMAKPLTIQ